MKLSGQKIPLSSLFNDESQKKLLNQIQFEQLKSSFCENHYKIKNW